VTLAAGEWTQLTNADATAVRVQNLGVRPVLIKARVGAGALSSTGGSITLEPNAIVGVGVTLAQMFPGVEGASRLYAFSETGGIVSVSHGEPVA
jgi:hypothetical protein